MPSHPQQPFSSLQPSTYATLMCSRVSLPSGVWGVAVSFWLVFVWGGLLTDCFHRQEISLVHAVSGSAFVVTVKGLSKALDLGAVLCIEQGKSKGLVSTRAAPTAAWVLSACFALA